MIEAITLFIIYIVLLIVSTVLQIVLRKKPATPHLLPSDLENIPVAERGKPIPVVLGLGFIKQPNVVWWGRVKSEPITVKTGGKS